MENIKSYKNSLLLSILDSFNYLATLNSNSINSVYISNNKISLPCDYNTITLYLDDTQEGSLLDKLYFYTNSSLQGNLLDLQVETIHQFKDVLSDMVLHKKDLIRSIEILFNGKSKKLNTIQEIGIKENDLLIDFDWDGNVYHCNRIISYGQYEKNIYIEIYIVDNGNSYRVPLSISNLSIDTLIKVYHYLNNLNISL
jgi:hypothetical protein